jgi:hypothetical protein
MHLVSFAHKDYEEYVQVFMQPFTFGRVVVSTFMISKRGR